MKKELIKVFKKFKHSVRLFLESSDKLNDLYLNSKKNKLEKLYCNEEVDNKKIVFTNYMGRGYGCNCKYLAENIISENKDYDLVWLVNENEEVPANIHSHARAPAVPSVIDKYMVYI